MTATYTATQKTLHWITALIVPLQWWTSRAVLRTHEIHAFGRKTDPFDLTLHRLHIYAGVTVLALTLWRIALRMRHGAPRLPTALPDWVAKTARAAHILTYAVLIALTPTGMITTYLWFGMGAAHRALVYVLYLFIVAHVVATIWHEAHGEGVLGRMLRNAA